MARRLPFWSALFLSATALSNLVGFFYPFHGMTLNVEVGAPSLVVLSLAAVARYECRLAGAWLRTYVVSALIALYLNAFLLVANGFATLMAPNARQPDHPGIALPITQFALFAAFAAVTPFALKRFHRKRGRWWRSTLQPRLPEHVKRPG